jgi:hypothetical protein
MMNQPEDVMNAKIIENTKYGALLVAVGAALFVANAHSIASQVRDVQARGVDAMAKVDGGSVSSSRRGSGTRLNLSWTDRSGQTRRESGIDISGSLANRIIANSTLKVDELAIKYLASEPNTKPIVIDDMNERLEANETNRTVFGIAAILGALVYGGMLLAGRRSHSGQAA